MREYPYERIFSAPSHRKDTVSTPQHPSHTQIYRWLIRHSKSTFVLMSASFVIFGGLSVNLVSHFLANANYLLAYQWSALMDGGLLQLIELLVKAIVSLGAYLLFKLCEHALIERMAHPLVPFPQSPVAAAHTQPKQRRAGRSAHLQVQQKIKK
jgi:hypothetical protein